MSFVLIEYESKSRLRLTCTLNVIYTKCERQASANSLVYMRLSDNKVPFINLVSRGCWQSIFSFTDKFDDL